MNIEIEKIVDTLPVLAQLYDNKAFLTVLDEEGTICGFSIPDDVENKFDIGEKFEDPSGAFDEVMSTGKKKFNYLPKEVMGEAFEGQLVPIYDEGDVVGCLVCSYSVEDKDRLTNIVSNFNEAVTEVSEKVGVIVDGFDSLYKMISEADKMTDRVEEEVSASEKVVGSISSNASKSNILALNASIEAARCGEAGRGFAVVAKEMGNLARESSASAGEIQKQLLEMHESIEVMVKSINGTDEVAKEYDVQIKAIKEVVDRMTSLANEMSQFVQN